MEPHLERARLLYGQSRYDQAERELRLHLADEPEDFEAHALLALCLLQRDRLDEAQSEARRAVHLAPDDPFPHFTLAVVLLTRERLGEAEASARESIRMAPEDADGHGLLAAILGSARRWPESLAAAEEGLALDPEHARCLNARAEALRGMGRKDDAEQQLTDALANDPEDSETHENLGWTLLDKGRHREALESFREALRLDAENASARLGIVEAMKARYPVYGLFLRYFLWMQKLSDKAQWGIVIGAFIVYRILLGMAKTMPWVWPLVVAYFVFAWMTWLAHPLFNLLLRLNRYGRHALSDEQRTQSNWVGGCLLLALGSLGVWLGARWEPGFLMTVYFALLLVPLAAIWAAPAGRSRRWMTAYAALLAAAGGGGLFLITRGNPAGETLGFVFLLGIFFHGWIANFVISMGRRWQ